MRPNWFRLIFTLIVAAVFLRGALRPEAWGLLDGLDLIFHEAGHTLFGWLPDVWTVAGGSITQVLIPLIVAAAVWRQGHPYSAGLFLFWVSQSILNVYVYAADALKQQLPLISDYAEHDWNFLLWRTGNLRHVVGIATTIEVIGWLVLVAATGICLYLSFEPKPRILTEERKPDEYS